MSNVNDLMSQVREDMDVYCSDGEKIGSVGEINIGTATGDVTSDTVSEERSFFQVTRGFLGLGGDIYILGDQIQGVSDDRVTLRCSSSELDNFAYGNRPDTPEPGTAGDEGGVAPLGLGLAASRNQGPGTTTGTGHL